MTPTMTLEAYAHHDLYLPGFLHLLSIQITLHHMLS